MVPSVKREYSHHFVVSVLALSSRFDGLALTQSSLFSL